MAATATVILAMAACVGQFSPLKGNAQPNSASFPFKSADRMLIDLNGQWTAFHSLRGAGQLTGTVGQQVYSVDAQVYGEANSIKERAYVPGSWDYPVITKQFYLSNELSGHNFRLYLLGAAGNTQVYVNGTTPAELIGTVPGNYIPAVLDIATPRLKFGEANTITLKLEQPQVLGPWFPFPGLTGEVYLEAVNSIALGKPKIDSKIASGGAGISLQIPVSSKLPKDELLNGEVSLYDAFGNLAATTVLQVPVGEEGRANVQCSLSLAQAHLWSPGDPYMYRLQVSVSSTAGERDSLSVPLGIREVKFAGKKLLLNGRELEPKTVQRVSDTPDSGPAANAADVENDLKLVKQLGYNILYIPDHTPQPYLYDFADRTGVLILSQVPVVGMAEDKAGAMVQAAQNIFDYHPSFLAQGLGRGLDLQESRVRAYVNNTQRNGLVFYTVLGNPSVIKFNNGFQLQLNAPYLADFLTAPPSFLAWSTAAQVNSAGIYSRERGDKNKQPAKQPQPAIPAAAYLALGIIALLLLVQSARLGNFRFSELKGKLRRNIRTRIRLQFYWFLLRLSVFNLLIVQTLILLQGKGYLDLWTQFITSYLVEICVRYLLLTPWAMFSLLMALGLLGSLLAAWPRARSVGQHPMAIILWLEKRKRWIVLALGAALFAIYGGPLWPVWAALGFALVSASLASGRDIRRVGGKTYSLLYLCLLAVIVTAVGWANRDWLTVVYHWYQLQGGTI